MSRELTIYTDGSCWPNPGPEGGWAFLIVEGKKANLVAGRTHEETTNNRQEMHAILRALEAVRPDKDLVVQIRTDSEWCVKVFSGEYKAKKNLDLVGHIRRAWRKAAYGNALELVHTRGHAGDPGNEIADVAAGGASVEDLVALAFWADLGVDLESIQIRIGVHSGMSIAYF